MWFCCDFWKVLRIRSELRKRKLASVTVERVLNIQGNILAAVVADVINVKCNYLTVTGDDNVYVSVGLRVCTSQ